MQIKEVGRVICVGYNAFLIDLSKVEIDVPANKTASFRGTQI